MQWGTPAVLSVRLRNLVGNQFGQEERDQLEFREDGKRLKVFLDGQDKGTVSSDFAARMTSGKWYRSNI